MHASRVSSSLSQEGRALFHRSSASFDTEALTQSPALAGSGVSEAALFEHPGRYAQAMFASASPEQIGAFFEGMRTLASLVQSVSKLSNFVLSLALDKLGARRGSVMLLDPERRFLRIRAARGISRAVKRQTKLPLGQGVAGIVADLALPLLINCPDARGSLPCQPSRYRSPSFLSVPLSDEGRVVGVLNVTEPESEAGFTERDLSALLQLANHVGPALGRALHYHAARQMALRDSLTGLYNRRYLWNFLDRLLRQARRQSLSVTLILFDLDHFKQFNDQYGHPAGDDALRRFAEIMRRTFRLRDVCCRIGGEEFAVVIWDSPGKRRRRRSSVGRSDVMSGYVFAERLRRSTSRYAFSRLESGGGLTLSGGLASFPRDGRSRSELFEKADQALYRAKCQGRNRICLPEGVR